MENERLESALSRVTRTDDYRRHPKNMFAGPTAAKAARARAAKYHELHGNERTTQARLTESAMEAALLAWPGSSADDRRNRIAAISDAVKKAATDAIKSRMHKAAYANPNK